MLILRGARINATNMGDDTALHLAASHGHRDIVLMVRCHYVACREMHGNISMCLLSRHKGDRPLLQLSWQFSGWKWRDPVKSWPAGVHRVVPWSRRKNLPSFQNFASVWRWQNTSRRDWCPMWSVLLESFGNIQQRFVCSLLSLFLFSLNSKWKDGGWLVRRLSAGFIVCQTVVTPNPLKIYSTFHTIKRDVFIDHHQSTEFSPELHIST